MSGTTNECTHDTKWPAVQFATVLVSHIITTHKKERTPVFPPVCVCVCVGVLTRTNYLLDHNVLHTWLANSPPPTHTPLSHTLPSSTLFPFFHFTLSSSTLYPCFHFSLPSSYLFPFPPPFPPIFTKIIT